MGENQPAISSEGPWVRGHQPVRRSIVAVLDGQGGGFGAAIIKELRAHFGESIEIWALGANSTATAAMMKAKANRGATGENAARVSLPKVDAIMGPIAVTWANAMMGEISPGLAETVTSLPTPKILIPLSQEGITLAGFHSEPLPHLVAEAVRQLAIIAGHK
ncbi:DUF3842 family protein [Deltaproteobacteria bacterium OttesenSCG-928-M10]|nr:DUF3842 family protein [Deltaproteobacteria bacterium OttesenSCG-928-M10]